MLTFTELITNNSNLNSFLRILYRRSEKDLGMRVEKEIQEDFQMFIKSRDLTIGKVHLNMGLLSKERGVEIKECLLIHTSGDLRQMWLLDFYSIEFTSKQFR